MAEDPKLLHCPALVTIKAISGKWKTRVLWLLRHRPHYFGEMRDLLPGVSSKVLTEQARQLINEGLVSVTTETRGRVVMSRYALTPYGQTLVPVLDLLGHWGVAHAARTDGRA